MNLSAESFTDLLFSFCSQPVPSEIVPDFLVSELDEEEVDAEQETEAVEEEEAEAEAEEEEEAEEAEAEEEDVEEEAETDEEDEFEHADSQIVSPSSSQDGEKNMATNSDKAIPDDFTTPDGDDTEEHTTKAQPKPAPWPQRVRLGKIPDRRATLSGRVSALENSMKKYADKKSEFVVKPEIGQEFDSLGEAYDFYNLYSWEIGFGIKNFRNRLRECKSLAGLVQRSSAGDLYEIT